MLLLGIIDMLSVMGHVSIFKEGAGGWFLIIFLTDLWLADLHS